MKSMRETGGADFACAQIAVIDRCPARRLGLASGLRRSGHEVEEMECPTALGSWLAGRERRAAVVSVLERCDLDVLRSARAARGDAALVALLPERGEQAVRAALLAGATAAASTDASIDELTAVVDAALSGKTLLDSAVAAALARCGPVDDPSVDALTREERDWLRALGRGTTVSDIACAAAFSERAMYRQLRSLYAHLGVENRTQAVTRAAQLGLLDDAGG